MSSVIIFMTVTLISLSGTLLNSISFTSFCGILSCSFVLEHIPLSPYFAYLTVFLHIT